MIYFKSNCDELLQDGSPDFTNIHVCETAAWSLIHFVPVFIPSEAMARIRSGGNESGFGGVILERRAIEPVELTIAFSIIAGNVDRLHCWMFCQGQLASLFNNCILSGFTYLPMWLLDRITGSSWYKNSHPLSWERSVLLPGWRSPARPHQRSSCLDGACSRLVLPLCNYDLPSKQLLAIHRLNFKLLSLRQFAQYVHLCPTRHRGLWRQKWGTWTARHNLSCQDHGWWRDRWP